jgi:hypothetical protein
MVAGMDGLTFPSDDAAIREAAVAIIGRHIERAARAGVALFLEPLNSTVCSLSRSWPSRMPPRRAGKGWRTSERCSAERRSGIGHERTDPSRHCGPRR